MTIEEVRRLKRMSAADSLVYKSEVVALCDALLALNEAAKGANNLIHEPPFASSGGNCAVFAYGQAYSEAVDNLLRPVLLDDESS